TGAVLGPVADDRLSPGLRRAPNRTFRHRAPSRGCARVLAARRGGPRRDRASLARDDRPGPTAGGGGPSPRTTGERRTARTGGVLQRAHGPEGEGLSASGRGAALRGPGGAGTAAEEPR